MRLNRTAMHLHELAGERETDTESFVVTVAGSTLIDSEERFEDSPQHMSRNTNAGITNTRCKHFSLSFHRNADCPWSFGIFHRIHNQIGKYLFQSHRVRMYKEFFGRSRDRKRVTILRYEQLHGEYKLVDKLVDGENFLLQRELLLRDARDIEEVV